MKTKTNSLQTVLWLLPALFLSNACGPLPLLDQLFRPIDTDSKDICSKQVVYQCLDGDVYEFDWCGTPLGIASDCHEEREVCQNIDAADAQCACRDGWTGEGCTECIRFVAHDSSAESPSGRSWSTAFSSIQEALDAAAERIANESDVESCQVWVKGGTYHAWRDSRLDSVQLHNGIALLGGFAGDETLLSERDFELHPTAISGQNPESSEDRVCHVVVGADDATLDGFTIRDGEASCAEPAFGFVGGGMLNQYVSPTVRNCSFVDNYSLQDGGAVYNRNNTAAIENCSFDLNASNGLGGAISNLHSSPTIDGCVFTDNTFVAINNVESSPVIKGAQFSGSGCQIRNDDFSEAVILDSVFSGVEIEQGSQVIYARDDSHITLQNCVFKNIIDVSSTSWESFDVVYSEFSNVKISNCTFLNTHESKDLVISSSFGSPAVINTIIWGNAIRDFVNTNGATPTVTHSLLTDLTDYPQPTNFTDDPLFINGTDGDLHLRAGSPCIDRADGDAAPEFDLDGNPRFDDAEVRDLGEGDPPFADVGAYEYSP